MHVKVRQVAVYPLAAREARADACCARAIRAGRSARSSSASTTKKWIRVYLPTRPNGSEGWVRARAVRMYTNGYRIVVRLRAHKLFSGAARS